MVSRTVPKEKENIELGKSGYFGYQLRNTSSCGGLVIPEQSPSYVLMS